MQDADGNPVRIALALPEGRTLYAQVWIAQVGRVPLLLLDTDVEENDVPARQVTDRLYGGGKEHRLEQELLLGIGGVRAIRAYCAVTGAPAPEVFHTNEGHAGFLGVERIRELVEDHRLSFDEALQAVRAGTVFTTHTPVPAGIDRFPRDLITSHLHGIPGVPIERILALGAEDDPSMFNMAHMGLRLGQRANGVSLLHGVVSREMFARPVAGLRRRRGADQLGHQRRPRADVVGARDPRHRPARGRLVGRWPTAAAGRRWTGSPTASCGASAATCASELVDEIRRRVRDSSRSAVSARPSSAGRRRCSTRTC